MTAVIAGQVIEADARGVITSPARYAGKLLVQTARGPKIT